MNFEKGDTVKHLPTGETWLLIRVKDEYVYPGGWPASRARAADCVLVEKGDPETIAWIDASLAKAGNRD